MCASRPPAAHTQLKTAAQPEHERHLIWTRPSISPRRCRPCGCRRRREGDVSRRRRRRRRRQWGRQPFSPAAELDGMWEQTNLLLGRSHGREAAGPHKGGRAGSPRDALDDLPDHIAAFRHGCTAARSTPGAFVYSGTELSIWRRCPPVRLVSKGPSDWRGGSEASKAMQRECGAVPASRLCALPPQAMVRCRPPSCVPRCCCCVHLDWYLKTLRSAGYL